MGSCADLEPWKRRDWLQRQRGWNSGGLRIWIWEKDALPTGGYVNSSADGPADTIGVEHGPVHSAYLYHKPRKPTS